MSTAYIKALKNANGDIIYPQTTTSAIYNSSGVLIEDEINTKTDKKIPSVIGNFASLDSTGNLIDSEKNGNSFALLEHTHIKNQITDFPTSMAPTAHKSTHATGGTDALTPADIGAAPAGSVGELLASGSGFALANSSIRPTLGDKAIDLSYTNSGTKGATGQYAYAEGCDTLASNACTHAEGSYTTASGYHSHAEGNQTQAGGDYAHAEGHGSKAKGNSAHAEGSATASGMYAHAEGEVTTAGENSAHAEGSYTTASGYHSHAEGTNTKSNVYSSHAQGQYNKTLAGGAYSYSGTADAFVIGNGTSSSTLANAFRVTFDGKTYGLAAFNSSGADYAEYFEWVDGNPNSEDRTGFFVTLDGEKIRKAMSADAYILGIISACPSVIGDSYDDDWSGKYITDAWGRIQYETVNVPAEIDKDGNVIHPARVDTVPKLNPAWNNSQPYISREKRKEWSAVGMMGKLLVRDDGSCIVNGFCNPNDNGVATNSTSGYRVMSRISDNIIKVLIK